MLTQLLTWGCIISHVHISCFVDDSAEMRMQAWNWAVSLRSVETRCRVFIHHTPTALSRENQIVFRSLGATLVEANPFGRGPARYCNKIQQLATAEFCEADYIILSDADIFFLGDPADWTLPNVFRAKPVDLPNPPEAAWRQLFEDVNLADQVDDRPIEIAPDSKTFSTNFNGGLYIFPASEAKALAQRWSKYALLCLQRRDILGRALHHSDQIAMGMALAELPIEVSVLPTGANLPTHLSPDLLACIPQQVIKGLHYHGHVDNHGRPLTTGLDWIDRSITNARRVLDLERRSAFSNSIFWDFRYTRFPALGSGLGSRGESLLYKRELLARYFCSRPPGRVLDVGCGDIEVTRELQIEDYTGLDTSAAALEIAREKRPDWSFLQDPVSTLDSFVFDYTICLDVLIHQPNKSHLLNLIGHVLRVTRREIVFSAHKTSEKRRGISFDSDEVPKMLAKRLDVAEVMMIGEYRDVGVFVARKLSA